MDENATHFKRLIGSKWYPLCNQNEVFLDASRLTTNLKFVNCKNCIFLLVESPEIQNKPLTPDEILMKASELYEERREVYGDNWTRIGPILQLLLDKVPMSPPRRGPIWYYDRVHLITMIVVKLTRFIVGMEKGEHHKDSTRDLIVYAAMLDSLGE